MRPFGSPRPGIPQLTVAQQAALDDVGFVVVPAAGFSDMYEVYETCEECAQPAFVTSDTVLHTAHVLFDYLLRILEIRGLRQSAEVLTEALLAASQRRLTEAEAPAVQESARRNLAFFAVGQRLLDPARATPSPVREMVNAELSLMDKHDGLEKSPTVGCREDYSQYVPRGHYTRNAAFRAYFQAMMWYGRMGFYLNPSESLDVDEDDVRRLTRQALLIVRALGEDDAGSEPAVAVWRRLYDVTAFFAGRAEDLDYDAYRSLADEVFGGLPTLAQLADDTLLDEFMARARRCPPPKVLSTIYFDDDAIAHTWQEATLGFHFLGQRFTPDAYIFQKLVYDAVGFYRDQRQPFTLIQSQRGPIRGFPRGLDVMAAFGSSLAERIIEREGDAEYDGYPEQLAGLAAEFSRLDEVAWRQNLYWSWLNCLRPLLDAPPVGGPAFTHSDAWAAKLLNAALGSWAELRHDTLLYVKQSYTAVTRGVAPSPPQAYVEPVPEVFGRIKAMIAWMRQRLTAERLLPPPVAKKLADFERVLGTLQTVSAKELTGQAPTPEEQRVIENTGPWRKSVTTLSRDIVAQIASGTDDRIAAGRPPAGGNGEFDPFPPALQTGLHEAERPAGQPDAFDRGRCFDFELFGSGPPPPDRPRTG